MKALVRAYCGLALVLSECTGALFLFFGSTRLHKMMNLVLWNYFAAAKTAINLFLHMPEVTSREKELIKACTDPEMVAAIVGNAKITAPGLTQLKQKQKKGKKSSSSKDID
jgi:siroheme synthase